MRTPLVRLDPGWLFVLAGLVLIAATALIPAQRELAVAHWHRDRALAVEAHHRQRVTNYQAYFHALERNDDTVVLSLAATQLNRSPETRVPLSEPVDITRVTGSVFPQLEPPPLVEPAPPAHYARAQALSDARANELRTGQPVAPELLMDPRESTLERWATDDRLRLWLFAGGVLCLLIGLLPASTPREASESTEISPSSPAARPTA
jgi:hypothetical protein